MKSRIFCIALMACLPALPQAHGGGLRQDFRTLRAAAAAWLEAEAVKGYPDTLARVEIGMVDERLNLPACPEPRFFLPSGVDPWGNGSLGARCEAPKPWSLYIRFASRLRGPALIATHPLPARYVPVAGDLELRLLDYDQDPDMYPRELPPGAQLLRPLAPGQALVLTGLRQPDAIRAGQKVRLTVAGSGFTVTQEGVALGNASQGQPVRVKTASGRIVQGVATRDGQVSIRP